MCDNCECDWGIVFSVLNFICGVGIVIGHFSLDDPCDWLRVLIGISICWVAITHRFCDQYALAWFPFWEKSFVFMGCTFIFFSCGAWNRGCHHHNNDNDNCNFGENFAAFFLWVTFAVGFVYILLGAIEFFAGASISHPVPLEGCCGIGGGGGGGGDSSGGKKENDELKESNETNEKKESEGKKPKKKGRTTTGSTAGTIKKKRKKKATI